MTDKLLQKIINKMVANPHGYAIYSYSPSPQKKYILRTLSFKKALESLITLEKAKAVHMHFRYGTTGAISLENVHLWTIDDLLISHNGFVHHYNYSKKGKSDTKQLVENQEFQKLLKKRNFKKLWDLLGKRGFWGVMLITSRDFSEIYVIAAGKRPYYLRYKKMTIISNDYLLSEKSELLGEGIYKIENNNVKEIIRAEYKTTPITFKSNPGYSNYYSYVYDINDPININVSDYILLDDDYCTIKCKSNKTKKNKKYEEYIDYAFF